MLNQLHQYSDVGLFLLRLAIGIIFAVHAIPKLKNSKEMSGGMGMPSYVVFLLGVVELLGSVAIALGFYVQIVALVFSCIMLGAIWKKINSWHVPFFAHTSTGWEFDFILLFANLLLFLGGGGSIGF
jgi:putative oxidoreductase